MANDSKTFDQLSRSLDKILPVPFSSAREYRESQEHLAEDVNASMTGNPDIKILIGENPFSLMFDNHANHAAFMSNIFIINDSQLLLKIILWAYRTYHARGFTYNYFPAAMKAWIVAVNKYLDAEKSKPIISVYNWIIENHEHLIAGSQEITEPPHFIDSEWSKLKDNLFSAILDGNTNKAMQIASDNIQSASDLTNFYLYVIQPALYDIGLQWEKGHISVAQEHLASAIVTRVMSSLYPRFAVIEQNKGKAIVSAAPNEFHEIGPRMVADLLEIDGWDVDYTGANVPAPDLVSMAVETKPFFIAISIGMPFNIDQANDLIRQIKAEKALNRTKIMLGGYSLTMNPQLKKLMDIDGCGDSASDAVKLATEWWNNA
ncbi:MAG: cobalamin B12-binding domain-containing protein [Bacillota bacterium]